MRFNIYRNIKGEWSWRLIASNGRIVAVAGEGYKRRSTMIRSMKLIFGGDAEMMFRLGQEQARYDNAAKIEAAMLNRTRRLDVIKLARVNYRTGGAK